MGEECEQLVNACVWCMVILSVFVVHAIFGIGYGCSTLVS